MGATTTEAVRIFQQAVKGGELLDGEIIGCDGIAE